MDGVPEVPSANWWRFEILRVISQEFAAAFAQEWIAAWNAHDLERILAHYTDDLEMSSPVIAQTMNEPSGRLRGKAAIGGYWAKALAAHPGLSFECVDTFAGANSVTVLYRGHRGLSAEVFWFDDRGLVCRAAAHYRIAN